MISLTTGNLLQSEAEALVNTVNCVGFMGKGIALQFKQAYPDNYEAYRKACERGEVVIGKMFIFETGKFQPKLIINFPTKRHWKAKSRIEDIRKGLQALTKEISLRGIRSIAVPPLGAGLGGLQWQEVKQEIENALANIPDLQVLLFEPQSAPVPAMRPVNTRIPNMTRAKALYIKLMRLYGRWDYRMTLLEIQKLSYFLQESGEDMRLRFEQGAYGPYADNLNKVLESTEGHFTRGYTGGRKPDEEIDLLPGAEKAADQFLADHPDCADRLERLSNLIDGFESPYGMELLASAHWVAAHGQISLIPDEESIIEAVHSWNERKRRIMKPDHIRIAWRRLQEEGWIKQSS